MKFLFLSMVALSVTGLVQSCLNGIWLVVFCCAVLSMPVKCRVVSIKEVFLVEWVRKCICSFYLIDKKNKINYFQLQ